ncbi:MAG TPA: TadE/TadG family type IV pilus assembly protein [Rhizomicrobium sp.]
MAIIFGLSVVPITIAAGAGLDFARALMVRARIEQALDAAGLAVGGASQSGMSQSQLQTLAQQYFNANYVEDHSFGTPASVSVTVAADGKSATLATSIVVPTVLVKVGDVMGCTHCDSVTVPVSSTIVWGTTKLWVALVLDNTGSMTQTDASGTSKISALKTATHQLLTILQGAASTPGDVQVSIVPFSKDVNVGTGNVGASWIDWTDWASQPANGAAAIPVTTGPSDTCPFTTASHGFACQSSSTNASSAAASVLSTCTINGTSYNGCICPTVDNGSRNSGRLGHYYNGCYVSVSAGTTTTVSTGSTATCTVSGHVYHNCSCSGSFSSKTCRATNYNHNWTVNAHSTWNGCITDRTQNSDVTTGTSSFPAENAQSCVPSVMKGQIGYDWAGLSTEVDNMSAGGSTNQPIGLVWGWQSMTQGAPLSAPTLPQDSQRYIILVSDGLNTQDRWYGDGSNQATGVNDRMTQVCNGVKAQGITVYTIFVDLGGTQGNSSVLQSCASDSSKYFDLTTSGAIISTLNNIAEDIVHLRVAR